MPETPPAMAAALAISASISRPATGRTWIVTSRARSACQSPAAARNSMTAPMVIEARKVMMAMTAIKACPAIVAFGTIEAADMLGLPVSTTHILSSGIAGTMVANGSGIQRETVRNILLAWVLTLPVCVMLGAALFGAALFFVLRVLGVH